MSDALYKSLSLPKHEEWHKKKDFLFAHLNLTYTRVFLDLLYMMAIKQLKKHHIIKIKFDLSIFIIRTSCNTMSSKLGLTIIFQKEYLLRKIKENDLD